MTAVKHERQRKANFSEDEMLTLIEEVSKERMNIMGNRKKEKDEAWENICFKLNAMFGNNRRSQELKKKWKDMKSRARVSRARQNGTEGQKKDSFFHNSILNILGTEKEISATNGNDNQNHEPAVIKSPPADDECDSSAEAETDEVDRQGGNVLALSSSFFKEFKKKRREQRESKWKTELQLAEKRELEIKWLKSEIAKNNSIVELNYYKTEYMKAKKAKLEVLSDV